jgi:Mn-dependent DtxR family transcriptional regulator
MSQNAEPKSVMSVCDVMRDSTEQVIMKIEGLLPSYIEGFADLQSEGLRIARDFFGTCYIAEKELEDKLGVDQKAIESFERFSKLASQTAISQIDMWSNIQKTFVENTMSAMESYDNQIKAMLSSYAKMLQYASTLVPKTR